MAKGKSKFYAVAAGRQPGIYSTWAECERQVKGFSGARFKSFKTREEASAFVGSAGTQTAGGASVAPRSEVSASTTARTNNSGANQQSTSSAGKRPAASSTYSAPSAAKRPRKSANDDNNANNNGIVITVYFDGGARGNPGVAGAGAVITSQINGEDTSQVVKIRQYCGPNATNNVAEYTGLLLGLRTAKDFAEKYWRDMSKTKTGASAAAVSLTSSVRATPPIDIRINIRGDSDLIIKQMNGQYKCKNAKLMPLYDDCRSIASQLKMMEHANLNVQGGDAGMKCRVSIDMSHVYRNDNKVADALANEAMDERRSWRTEFVRYADGHEEEVVGDDTGTGSDKQKSGSNGGEEEGEKKKRAEVIEIV